MEDLEKYMLKLLEFAKDFLQKNGGQPTIAIFEWDDRPPIVKELDMSPKEAERSHARVQQVVLKLFPSRAVIISDSWMATAKTAKIPDDYKRGWVEQQPDRTEAIVITAGSVYEGVKAVILPYERKEEKIIFGEVLTQGMIETAFFGNAWEVRRKQETAKAQKEADAAMVH